jgi:hypothetical protein
MTKQGVRDFLAFLVIMGLSLFGGVMMSLGHGVWWYVVFSVPAFAVIGLFIAYQFQQMWQQAQTSADILDTYGKDRK